MFQCLYNIEGLERPEECFVNPVDEQTITGNGRRAMAVVVRPTKQSRRANTPLCQLAIRQILVSVDIITRRGRPTSLCRVSDCHAAFMRRRGGSAGTREGAGELLKDSFSFHSFLLSLCLPLCLSLSFYFSLAFSFFFPFPFPLVMSSCRINARAHLLGLYVRDGCKIRSSEWGDRTTHDKEGEGDEGPC